MSGHRITSVATPAEAISAFIDNPEQDLILFNTYAAPPESFEIAYRLHCQPQIIKIPMLITSVHDHEFENLGDPNIDAFTVGYITEISRLDELENLMNCLRGFKKLD